MAVCSEEVAMLRIVVKVCVALETKLLYLFWGDGSFVGHTHRHACMLVYRWRIHISISTSALLRIRLV